MKALVKFFLVLTILLLPLAVSDAFVNFFDPPKIIILVFGVSLALLFTALQLSLSTPATFKTGTFDKAVLFLALAYLLSALVKTPNKMEAFFLPGVATVVLASGFLYFLINNVEDKKSIVNSLVVSAVLLSFVLFLGYFGILGKIPPLPAFIKNRSFSPTGDYLSTIIFLLATLPVHFAKVLTDKSASQKILNILFSVIIVGGLILSVFQISRTKGQLPLPDFQSSWNVAVDSLKESPIFGVGPANFIGAFGRLRPISYNSTPFWSILFTSARNWYLTVGAEAGLLGLTALFFLFLDVIKSFEKNRVNENKYAPYVSFLILTLALVFAPSTTLLAPLFFIFLALVSDTREVTISQTASKSFSFFVSLLTLGLLAAVGFYFYRAILAEALFKKAQEAINKNDGKATYDFLRQAISKNAYVDRYRITNSQVNLALARSVAGNKEISDKDKETISALIKQAITEAKAGIALNPQRAQNWAVLAQVYQTIMSLTSGADKFAIESYNQAIALDPINPNLRIGLGGVYYSLGRLDEAIDAFRLATLAKPDLANAHYNLAAAYREKGEIDKAIAEINTVLSLVDKNSKDYETAKAELDSLEKKRPSSTKKTEEQENLTSPTKSQKLINPPLPLPEEATPSTTTP